jgi:(2Fe-2S) ferredoxin
MKTDFTDVPAPYFETHLFCCVNQRAEGHSRGCCSSKGSEAIRDYLKSRAKALGIPNIRVNASGCLDRCELGPTIVIYPEGVWYRCPTKEDAERILQEHVIGKTLVKDLMLTPEMK